MRVVQPQAVAGTVRPSGAPARTGGRYAGVLALQRSIGNAATRRLLARSPRKPYQHQWENPDLVATIYPAREAMLRKFVTMYREIELADIKDPEERKAAAARLKEGTDALKDDALMAEVKRLLATKGAPEWLGPGAELSECGLITRFCTQNQLRELRVLGHGAVRSVVLERGGVPHHL